MKIKKSKFSTIACKTFVFCQFNNYSKIDPV